MISLWGDRLRRQTWHPSFEDLLLYLEGELGAQGDRVGNHVKRCWSCRLRLEKIERAISDYMEARNASLGTAQRLPRRASINFGNKLARLEAECGGPDLFSDLMRMWTWEFGGPAVTARAAIFTALVGLLFAVVFRLSMTPYVSANEVLSRAQQAEVRQTERINSPVIYEKLELSRRSGARQDKATWEIWDDTHNKRLRQRVGGDGEGSVTTIPATHPSPEAPAVGDLTEIFSSHQADLGRPLCAANYETWRAAIPQVSEKVTEGRLPNGKKAAILEAMQPEAGASAAGPGGATSGSSDPAPSRIIRAELVVRTDDWHPVSERLWVDDRVYEIAELDYRVLPLTEVDAMVFATSPVIAEAEEIAHPAPAELPGTLMPPPPDPDETEVAVRYSLHQLNADLGEPVRINRDPRGEIVVDASEAPAELQTRLKQRLASIPNASLELKKDTPQGCDKCSAPPPEITGTPPSSPLAIAPVANPNEKRLEEIFGDSHAQESFTQEVLSVSGDALSRGFALRNLALRYPPDLEAKLSADSQAALKQMVNDHINALGVQTKTLQGLLRPLLEALSSNVKPNAGSRGASTGGARPEEARGAVSAAPIAAPILDSQPASAPWQKASLEIFAAVQKADRMIKGLLTRTNTPIPADQVVPELRQALTDQQQRLNQYE